MYVKAHSRDDNIAAATVTLLKPRRFDEQKRPLEPYCVSVETGGWMIILTPDDWSALRQRIDESFGEAWPART